MSKLKDAIYGFSVADALGVPYEFRVRGQFKCVDMIGFGTWNQPVGTWSDDTSMTIATCKSIKDRQEIDLSDIMNNFKKWYNENKFTPHKEVFDIGNTTRISIITGKGMIDINSNGNGSLMRILPLAFTNATDDEIRAVSSLTHGHFISTESCVIYVSIARKLIEGKNIIDILNEIKYREPFNRLNKIYELEEKDIKSSGYVLDTLEACLWCLSTTKNYQECVLKAVNLGGDTDTISAIAGGLAGIAYGIKNIPVKWINALVNKNLIDECLF